jgi:hypothetical protein
VFTEGSVVEEKNVAQENSVVEETKAIKKKLSILHQDNRKDALRAVRNWPDPTRCSSRVKRF